MSSQDKNEKLLKTQKGPKTAASDSGQESTQLNMPATPTGEAADFGEGVSDVSLETKTGIHTFKNVEICIFYSAPLKVALLTRIVTHFVIFFFRKHKYRSKACKRKMQWKRKFEWDPFW